VKRVKRVIKVKKVIRATLDHKVRLDYKVHKVKRVKRVIMEVALVIVMEKVCRGRCRRVIRRLRIL